MDEVALRHAVSRLGLNVFCDQAQVREASRTTTQRQKGQTDHDGPATPVELLAGDREGARNQPVSTSVRGRAAARFQRIILRGLVDDAVRGVQWILTRGNARLTRALQRPVHVTRNAASMAPSADWPRGTTKRIVEPRFTRRGQCASCPRFA